MKEKGKKQKDAQKEFQKSKVILLLLFVLVLCFSIFLWMRNLLLDQKNQSKFNIENRIQTNTVEEKEILQEEANQLSQKSDPARIKYYFNQYLNLVENGEYEKAYEMLYAEFKQNYFPTKEKFIAYAKERYASFMKTEYADMQRQGNIYILEVKIEDPLQPQNPKHNFTQKFIIQEQNVNEYVLSFEVVE